MLNQSRFGYILTRTASTLRFVRTSSPAYTRSAHTVTYNLRFKLTLRPQHAHYLVSIHPNMRREYEGGQPY